MALAGLLSCLRPCPVHLQGVEGRFYPCVCLCLCSLSRALSARLHLYTEETRPVVVGRVSRGVSLGVWRLVSPIRIGTRQAGRAFCHISVYLGRWFQSCGPLGLRYSTDSRGLWPRCGSYSGTLSGCVSSPYLGRFRGLQE